MLDVAVDDDIVFEFYYHMQGIHIGNLKVQASQDPTFETGVTDLIVCWDCGGTRPTSTFYSTVIAGEQTGPVDGWFKANFGTTDSLAPTNSTIQPFLGKRFYVRFLYTAGISHLGDLAIDDFKLYKDGKFGDVKQNSFKLFHPTYDNHNRPYATFTREDYAKRPLNIRNIHMTGNTPTQAGNFLDRYEYVNTTSPEANDPWFVKNVESIQSLNSEIIGLGSGSIQEILSGSDGVARTKLRRRDFALPERNYLSGNVRNRTRFKSRFSSPGGFEVMSRGYLDVEHEIFSVYNAMPYRNNWARTVNNSQLQAHCGKFGVSTHEAGQSLTPSRYASGSMLAARTDNGERRAVGVINFTTGSRPDADAEIILTDTAQNVIRFQFKDTAPTTGSGEVSVVDGKVQVHADEDPVVTAINLRQAINAFQYPGLGRLHITASGPAGNGVDTNVVLYLHQIIPGFAGNTKIRTAATGSHEITDRRLGHDTNQVGVFDFGTLGLGTLGQAIEVIPDVVGFGPFTARVYGTERTGSINAGSYRIDGDAAAHKYHRNNIEKVVHIGEDASTSKAIYYTASFYDNAFVSHTIPRLDHQVRWITSSLI